MLRRFHPMSAQGMGGALWLAGVAALLMSCAGDLPVAPDRAAVTPHLVVPTNDNFADATVIGSLPYSNTVDITEATTEVGEPPSCAFGGANNTVWYSYTPATTGWVSGSFVSSSPIPVVGVYTGASLGTLAETGCLFGFGGRLAFEAQAGTTYHFQVGGAFGQSGPLEFHLEDIPVPPNDDFANAAAITALPFSNTVDNTSASIETGEPSSSCAGTRSKTVWYAFTATGTGSVSARAIASGFPTAVAAYTGASLTNLTETGCRVGRLTFQAQVGTTYYFQVDDFFGQGGPLEFLLEVTPPPVANLFFSPFDPSAFDIVQFLDFSFDPGEAGFVSQQWTFGDGTTGSGCCPTHRYAADGSYTVQLTVTTVDGRTAATSQTVPVRTHDVAITKLSVPKSASAGQTRAISVGVRNTRYPETVEIQLLKSVPGGFQLVGTSIQAVPVRSGNRTTDFTFNYTFTADDAGIGKVTFKAFALLVGARDALGADNEAIAPPTKVR